MQSVEAASKGSCLLDLVSHKQRPTPSTHCHQPWSTGNIVGLYRFLTRAHRRVTTATADVTPSAAQLREAYTCVKKVTIGTETLNFAAALTAQMEFFNASAKWESVPK